MSEVERKGWERAREAAIRRLRENQNPKLTPRLTQELAIIENLLSQADGPYFCYACNEQHSS